MSATPRKPLIGVIGASRPSAEEAALAEAVGRAIGRAGAILLCGGLGGVMEAACRGAKEAGGLTVGILPTEDPADANPYVDIPVATGIGEARNAIVARAPDALVAVGGGYGTLSEIALALKGGKRVVGLRAPAVEGILPARTAEEAVALARGAGGVLPGGGG
ncbi:MAG TPA: TIGR00725 family protein [Planctomycetota bacterium]|nr:TIGR00725 family protein [Planctomycetota bacterium]